MQVRGSLKGHTIGISVSDSGLYYSNKNKMKCKTRLHPRRSHESMPGSGGIIRGDGCEDQVQLGLFPLLAQGMRACLC